MSLVQGQPDTRLAILAAANAIVRASGPAGLTLAEAARKAGVSKGGLLYHFGSKDALITGMIDHALHTFDRDVEELAAQEPAGPGQWLRTFVRVTFAARPEHAPSPSILAAAAVNPELLEPVSRYFERWHARAISDGCDPVLATIVRLASDGLWFADIFTSTSPQGADRAEVLERLLALIDEKHSSNPVSEVT